MTKVCLPLGRQMQSHSSSYIASLPPYANVSAMPRMVAGMGLSSTLRSASLPMHKEGRVAVSDGVSAVAHGVVERYGALASCT